MGTKIKVGLSIGLSNCEQTDTFTLEEIGLTQAEWDNMTSNEKDAVCDEQRIEHENNYLDSWGVAIDE